ncbi:hypothetical protein COLO4_06462 [Corchorus olitorius]|uniref:Uncharacterized protein n=1 Tax=Corchorus olitorius TaxID=93759 RepID=A0A1R3KMZ6_9ROSI|nr:hypothetical protein COLO4_06462 [Corchorus olitorius]
MGDLEETKARNELKRLRRTDPQPLSSIRVLLKLRRGGAWWSEWRRRFQYPVRFNPYPTRLNTAPLAAVASSSFHGQATIKSATPDP